MLALDPAATEFFKGGKYVYEGEGVTRDIEAQVKYLADLSLALPDRIDRRRHGRRRLGWMETPH